MHCTKRKDPTACLTRITLHCWITDVQLAARIYWDCEACYVQFVMYKYSWYAQAGVLSYTCSWLTCNSQDVKCRTFRKITCLHLYGILDYSSTLGNQSEQCLSYSQLDVVIVLKISSLFQAENQSRRRFRFPWWVRNRNIDFDVISKLDDIQWCQHFRDFFRHSCWQLIPLLPEIYTLEVQKLKMLSSYIRIIFLYWQRERERQRERWKD